MLAGWFLDSLARGFVIVVIVIALLCRAAARNPQQSLQIGSILWHLFRQRR